MSYVAVSRPCYLHFVSELTQRESILILYRSPGVTAEYPATFEAISLKDLDMGICSYPFYVIFYLQWL